ncbi:MAG TPA: cytochrome c3 family protein, partial [Stellaceae bacterium]|nr:cytochrome c3 family protein [Stellaceae bacterium]
GGFPSGHPQFRPTVVANSTGPVLARIAVDATPPPVDHPGIKFSHAAHLVADGFPALGYQPMACADCHVAEPSGQGFQPITYKQQCAGCHALDFDRQDLPWPSARVPHGDDVGVAAAVWNFYAGKALQGGITEAPAPAVVRRAPGVPAQMASDTAGGDARQWVADKTEAALRTIVFDQKRGCAYCHYGAGPGGEFDVSSLVPMGAGPPGPAPGRIVAPVALRTRFLPHARFDHAKHAAMDCEQCHTARTAEALGQMLIPGIANCAKCHGADDAALHAQSTCITCHNFHSGALGQMRSTAASAAQ